MSKGGFSRWFDRKGWVGLVIGLPYVWLVALFLLPFLIVLAMSVATNTPTAPPSSFGGEHPWINLGAYERIATDGLYVRAFLTSIFNAFVSAMLCLLIGYPMALGLTRVSKSWRNILLMLVILPFWTSFLLRVYAWMGLMGKNSWFNTMLTDI
jgi:putrescine transport system permease protein